MKTHDWPLKIRRKSRVFLFYNGFKMPGKCLVCALLAKKCLAVCLALYLAFDAQRCGRGGSGCEICGRSGCGCCTCREVSAGGFPIAGTGTTWAGLRAGVGRSDRRRGGCCSRRGLRLASSAGRCSVWLLLGVGLWLCWRCSPCLICG